MDSILRSMPVNGFRICVDEKNTDIAGRVYSPLLVETVEFSGFNELLLKMDRIFDRVGYPEAFQEKRTFGTGADNSQSFRGIPKAVQDEESVREHQGKIDTFDVVVTARRNTSWQGEIYDAQKQEICTFKGEIELLETILTYKK